MNQLINNNNNPIENILDLNLSNIIKFISFYNILLINSGDI